VNARTVWEFWHAVHRIAQLTVWVSEPGNFAAWLEKWA
jgi:hypothetical protein